MKARRWLCFIPILGVFWLLNVSRPGTKVEGCFEGCAAPRENTSADLRVISLNMLHGFPKFEYLPERMEIIATEINRLNADIVLLQEVPWTLKTGSMARFLAEEIGMNYAYLRVNGNRWAILFEEGEAILSRFPLSTPDWVELQPKAGFFEHRVALRVTALTPMGDLDLFVTHLTHGDPEVNLGQSQTLAEFVSDTGGEPLILAGDFNARPDSPQIQIFARNWLDSSAANDSPDQRFTCCTGILSQSPAELYDKRIDYVFASNGLEILGVARVFDQPIEVSDGWLWPSDHAGVMVDLAWLP